MAAPHDSATPAGQLDVDLVVRRLVGMFAPEPTPLARPDDALLHDLGFSSLRLMELAFVLEDLFAMEPSAAAEAPPAGTVRDLCGFIADKVASGEATMPTPEAVETAVAGL